MVRVRHEISRCLLAVILASAVCVLPRSSSAATFEEHFDGSAVDPQLNVVTNGCTFQLLDDRGVFTKAAGTGNSSAGLDATFFLIGDFDVSIAARRIDMGPVGEMGLAVYFSGGDGADIFFVDGGRIHSNVVLASVFSRGGADEYATEVTFRIRRSGDTLFLDYDAGSGWINVQTTTDPRLSRAAQANVFMLQEYGNTAWMQGSVDDLIITADEFSGGPVSVQQSTWGRVKALYR